MYTMNANTIYTQNKGKFYETRELLARHYNKKMDCPEIEPRFLIIITEFNPRKINSVNFEFHFRSIVFTLIAIARCCTIKGIVIIVQLPRAS